MFRLAVFLVFIGMSVSIQAQTANTCLDETQADPFYPCGSFFAPVCACNGETYYSECAARWHGGVYSGNWQSGPCTEFYYKLFPNPAVDFITINFQFKESGFGNIYLMNMLGEIVIQRNVRSTNNSTLNLNLSLTGIPSGLYFFTIVTNSYRQTTRLAILKN